MRSTRATQSTRGRVSRPTTSKEAEPTQSTSRRVSRPTTTGGKDTRATTRSEGRVSRPTARSKKSASHKSRATSPQRKRRVSRRTRDRSTSDSSSERDHRRKRPRASRRDTSSSSSSSDEFSSEPFSDESDMNEAEQEQQSRRPGSIPTEPSTSHVDGKTKKKILKGEYFDISKLLPSLFDYEEQKEKNIQSRPLSFYQWVRCFHTYMSIRLGYAPQELQGMLRHCEIVQDLYGQGKDGMLYDARFRRKKEQYPFISWGEYLADIVDGLPRRRPSQPFKPLPFPQATQRPAPTPYRCFKYNSTEGCHIRGCKFSHTCRKCGREGHPAFKCYART